MLLMDRLVSRSCRSLATMTGTAQPGAGRGSVRRRGRPTGVRWLARWSAVSSSQFSQFPGFTSKE